MHTYTFTDIRTGMTRDVPASCPEAAAVDFVEYIRDQHPDPKPSKFRLAYRLKGNATIPDYGPIPLTVRVHTTRSYTFGYPANVV